MTSMGRFCMKKLMIPVISFGNASISFGSARMMPSAKPFTIENEQMTPSMKIRRHILRQVYEDKIAALYRA